MPMAGIILLGFVLRTVNLGTQNLWIDEAFTYFAVTQPDLLTALARDVHPPLYFALVRGWSELVGTSEFALRYFSVLAGVVSIAVMYRLGRALRRDDVTLALTAALLLAVAEMESYTAQEARSYSLVVLWALLATWAYVGWLRVRALGGAGHGWAAAWAGSLLLVVYTYYLGVWVGVAQGLHALLFLRGRQRVVAVGVLLIPAVAFLPWLLGVTLPYQFNRADSHETMDASTLETLITYARSYLTGQWSLALGLTVLGVVMAARGASRRVAWQIPALLLLWILVALGLTFAGNTRYSIMTNYRLSQLTVPLVLLWAYGLLAFRPPVRAFLLAAMVVYSVFSVDFYRFKEPWVAYTRLATDLAQPGEAVMVDFKGVDLSATYYLDRMLDPGVRQYSLRRMFEFEPETFPAFQAALNAEPGLWVLRWNDSPVGLDLAGAGRLQTARREFPYLGSLLEVYRFDDAARFAGPVLATWDGGLTLRAAAVTAERLRVDLWWSASAPQRRDLTISAFLLDSGGRLVAQRDSYPMLGERPTSGWAVGEVVYDPRALAPVAALPAGEYAVGVVVYRFNARGGVRRLALADGGEMFMVGTLRQP